MNATLTKKGRRSETAVVQVARGITGIRIPEKRITSALVEVLRRERRGGRVDMIIVGDAMMRRLNKRFRGTDRATDVLSFPLVESTEAGPLGSLIGEVYCNYDHCRRWKNQHGGALTDELLRLAVHGCLHLLGYDHHSPSDCKAMSDAENRYLYKSGLIASRTTGRTDD